MKEIENKGNVYVIQEVSKFNVITAQEYGSLIPIFEEGKQILNKSGLKILSATDLNDAAKKIVEAVK